ncbi:MAG: hypothetical protein Q8922_03340 [Bacteroidota bacterium]|nr:hypothetical protein [Bacteroidota bacterium]MDP4233000.1 hypothetical protein [Bacteroidota bacterium]MDP4242044.1 hypothetical protein [Bacteroidota bacterium]MDP4286947.1 hypothetical protein [Bacteroidota bacterium]
MTFIPTTIRPWLHRYGHAAFFLFVAIVAFKAAGCDYRIIAPANGSSGPVTGLQVAVSPKTATIMPNSVVTLTAYVSGWKHDSTVQWSILAGGVGALSSNGNTTVFAAPAAIAMSPVLVTVRARSTEDTSQYADAVITISKQPIDTSHHVMISLSPLSVTLQAGQTQQFIATVTGTTNTGVTWLLVSGPGVLTSTGLYTAPGSISQKLTAIVRATSLADTSAWAQSSITISLPDTMPCFTRDIQPIINSNCTMSGCHSGGGGEARDLTTYAGIMSYVRAGNAGSSRLYRSITGSGEDAMPPYPRTPLTSAQINLIARWINDGALNSTCPADTSNCDTTAVSFSGFVNPIIQNACLGCHSGSNPSGGISLSTYSGVQTVANNGQLVGGITGTPPYFIMPQTGSPLDACTIAKIRAWVNHGAPNN